MKYAGSITITDDEGNAVYERELNADQIIELLLEKPAAPVATFSEAEVFPTKKNKAKGRISARANGVGKPCCGSLSTRHKKDCASAGSRAGIAETFNEADDDVSGGYRSCCGASTHGRHKAGCPEATMAGRNAHPQRRRTVDNRHAFSEPTYNVVKTLLEREDASSDMISAEKGLELEEVRRANLSNDYEDYLAIA